MSFKPILFCLVRINWGCKTLTILTTYPPSAVICQNHTFSETLMMHICEVVAAQTEMTRGSNQRPKVVGSMLNLRGLKISFYSFSVPLKYHSCHQFPDFTPDFDLQHITNLSLLIYLPIVCSKPCILFHLVCVYTFCSRLSLYITSLATPCVGT